MQSYRYWRESVTLVCQLRSTIFANDHQLLTITIFTAMQVSHLDMEHRLTLRQYSDDKAEYSLRLHLPLLLVYWGSIRNG